jgi:hypothetical protein
MESLQLKVNEIFNLEHILISAAFTILTKYGLLSGLPFHNVPCKHPVRANHPRLPIRPFRS